MKKEIGLDEVHLPRDEDIDDEEMHHFTAAELTTCWAL